MTRSTRHVVDRMRHHRVVDQRDAHLFAVFSRAARRRKTSDHRTTRRNGPCDRSGAGRRRASYLRLIGRRAHVRIGQHAAAIVAQADARIVEIGAWRRYRHVDPAAHLRRRVRCRFHAGHVGAAPPRRPSPASTRDPSAMPPISPIMSAIVTTGGSSGRSASAPARVASVPRRSERSIARAKIVYALSSGATITSQVSAAQVETRRPSPVRCRPSCAITVVSARDASKKVIEAPLMKRAHALAARNSRPVAADGAPSG